MHGTQDTLRDRLRRETAEAHERVDSLFGSCDFSTEQGYVRFLIAQAAAWETLRPILWDEAVARADALRVDLEQLGVALPPPLEGTRLPADASIGLRYVLEGSRLGSTVLMRALEAKAPDVAARAGAYLRESQKIEAWKQLSITLQKHDIDHDSDAHSVIDALFTFGLFERAWRATGDA